MTEAKFTPGPWKRELRFGEWIVRQDPPDWDGMGYQLICILPADKKDMGGDIFQANACLLEAAPDMLAALKQAKRLIDNMNEFGACTDGETYDAAWSSVEAAISKAVSL